MNVKNEKTLDYGDVKVTVKKMPLRKIAGLLNIVNELPNDVKEKVMGLDFDKMSNEQFLSSLPEMVTLLMPELAGVVAKACNSDVKPEVFLDELGVDENIEVIETILEINKVESVMARLKKLRALYQNNGNRGIVPVKNT